MEIVKPSNPTLLVENRDAEVTAATKEREAAHDAAVLAKWRADTVRLRQSVWEATELPHYYSASPIPSVARDRENDRERARERETARVRVYWREERARERERVCVCVCVCVCIRERKRTLMGGACSVSLPGVAGRSTHPSASFWVAWRHYFNPSFMLTCVCNTHLD